MKAIAGFAPVFVTEPKTVSDVPAMVRQFGQNRKVTRDIDLTTEPHTRVYIGFRLVARTPDAGSVFRRGGHALQLAVDYGRAGETNDG